MRLGADKLVIRDFDLHILYNGNHEPEWGYSERNTSRIFKHIPGRKLIRWLRVASAVKGPPCVNEIVSCVRGCHD